MDAVCSSHNFKVEYDGGCPNLQTHANSDMLRGTPVMAARQQFNSHRYITEDTVVPRATDYLQNYTNGLDNLCWNILTPYLRRAHACSYNHYQHTDRSFLSGLAHALPNLPKTQPGDIVGLKTLL